MKRTALIFSSTLVLLLVTISVERSGAQSPLRRGFRQIQLGIGFEQAQELLAADAAFFYRGEPDLSLSLSRSEAVIDSPGRGFVDRGLLQFSDGSLYILTLYLDQAQIDYFQVYESLVERYGDPGEINPQWARWEDGQTRIDLERPLTVRYLDLGTLGTLADTSGVERAIGVEARERFLDEL